MFWQRREHPRAFHKFPLLFPSTLKPWPILYFYNGQVHYPAVDELLLY
jgi:hypothetical protein